MASSIIDSMTSFMGPQVLASLASQLRVSTDTVQRGLEGGSAAILSGLAARADEPGFLGQIFGMITNPANSPSALSGLTSNISSAISGVNSSPLMEMGSRLLSTVFGSRLSSVTDAIGQYAGLGRGKTATLMSIAAPLVLGVLGQNVRENNLSANGLASELKSEATGLQRFLPAGLSSMLTSASSVVTGAATAAAGATSRWLWPVVLLAALLLAALWFFNQTKQPVAETMQSAANTMSSTASALGEFFKAKLPDGIELNIPQNGIENKLLAFINDSSRPVDDTTWFNFDRLLFDTGKATLQPSSQEQLNNIAAILKAYPNVHVKIGGYTDNSGDPQANMALSSARATNVMNTLVSQGIDPSRLAAEGYGDQHPVGDNSTDEGRAMNRRIALRVTQK
jgi:outer membrane protein OmpA-like peptidoglycan-associated protein